MEIIEWNFIYILLDLTRNSCEKCNFRPLAGIEPVAAKCRFAIPVQCSNQLRYTQGRKCGGCGGVGGGGGGSPPQRNDPVGLNINIGLGTAMF